MRQAESPASGRGVVAAEPCRSPALSYISLSPWMLLTAIAILAFNLRTGLASLPPLLGAIRQELGYSNGLAGLLTSIPAFCIGLFALLGARILPWISPERGILLAAWLVALATGLRLFSTFPGLLLASVMLIGMGIALIQVLVPLLVKLHQPALARPAMGVFAMFMNFGATVAAAASVPLALWTGAWPRGLALWGLPALLALAPWLLLSKRLGAGPQRVIGTAPLPWRDPRAWRLALFFSGTAATYFSLMAWLAPIYLALGWDTLRAGYLLTLFAFSQILGALVFPLLAHRLHADCFWLALVILVTAGGVLGLALLPLELPWVWSGLAGFGLGGLFPLLMSRGIEEAGTPAEAAQLGAFGQGFGILLGGGIAPLLFGILLDRLGREDLPLLVLGIYLLSLFGLSLYRPGQRAG